MRVDVLRERMAPRIRARVDPNGILPLQLLFVALGLWSAWPLAFVAPVVVGLGVDLVGFTILFAVCLQTSFLTPPVGFARFDAKGVAPPEIDVGTLHRGVLPFVGLQILGRGIIFVWPALVTWLPAKFSG